MTKTLSERVAARIAKHNASGRALNLATFLSLRSDIEQAIRDGWPIKNIWQTLHDEGKVGFGYQAFRLYVIRLIPSRQKAAAVAKQKESPPARASELPGFKFDPVGKKEDLL